MNPDQHMIDLAEKWMNGTITPEEERLFAEWYNAAQDNEIVVPADFAPGENAHRDRILRQLRRQMHFEGRRRFPRWLPAVAAALIFLLGSAAVWWISGRASSKSQLAKEVRVNPIQPIADKATLTLADGSTIDLNAVPDGYTAANGKAVINKKAAQLVYKPQHQAGAAAATPATVYNTLTTPRGGMYAIVLPDGTKVWLNAASSLRYPTAFRGQDREVTLTGEGYFEVAPNPDQPFRVYVGGEKVEVLGTHFDIMAYDDEAAIATTLLQGAVAVEAKDQRKVLKPGEQSRWDRAAGRMVSAAVDVNDAVAWKDGIFRFNSEDIRSVMRKLARWYDVRIQYEGDINMHFTGAVPRDADVSSLLRLMELTNAVRFRVEGHTITVTP